MGGPNCEVPLLINSTDLPVWYCCICPTGSHWRLASSRSQYREHSQLLVVPDGAAVLRGCTRQMCLMSVYTMPGNHYIKKLSNSRYWYFQGLLHGTAEHTQCIHNIYTCKYKDGTSPNFCLPHNVTISFIISIVLPSQYSHLLLGYRRVLNSASEAVTKEQRVKIHHCNVP